MADDFTIDRVSWHTSRPGTTETREQIQSRFRAFVRFLEENGLTQRPLSSSRDPMPDDFQIRSSDLTDEGMALVKAAYTRWINRVDSGMDPRNVDILRRALKRIRPGNGTARSLT